jgi:hypothetical protein
MNVDARLPYVSRNIYAIEKFWGWMYFDYVSLGTEALNVATLDDGLQAAGAYTISFDARNLASGAYLHRLQAGSFVQTKRMVLMR